MTIVRPATTGAGALAGFDQPRWHRVQAIIISGAVAAKAS
jgi:hypothetical protein